MIVGVNNVDGGYPARSDHLVYGASLAAGSGCDSMKIFMSDGYSTTDYPLQDWTGSTPTNLTELAQTTPMQAVFSSFNTIVCNTWSFANGRNNDWVNDADEDYLEDEYNEVKAFASWFLANNPGKTLVIQNWEGDWSLLGSFNEFASVPSSRPARMAAYLRARQAAVEDARRGSTSTARVLHGVEVNRVLDGYGARVHRDVLPNAIPDMISFSLYEAINTWGSGQADALANISLLFPRAAKLVRAYTKDKCPLYIGEFFWPETDAGFTSLSLDGGGLCNRVLDLAESMEFWGAFGWALFDNEARGYYVVKPDGSTSSQGAALRARW